MGHETGNKPHFYELCQFFYSFKYIMVSAMLT